MEPRLPGPLASIRGFAAVYVKGEGLRLLSRRVEAPGLQKEPEKAGMAAYGLAQHHFDAGMGGLQFLEKPRNILHYMLSREEEQG